MIRHVLGSAAPLEEDPGCWCLCDCYPHPRDGAYSDGYQHGTADGAVTVKIE